MKLIIFEGIASSGKTTIENLLLKELTNSFLISEGKTLMSLIENRDSNIAVSHLIDIIKTLQQMNYDYVILDRFHLTHAFRTNVHLNLFASVEDALFGIGEAHIVLLIINPRNIHDRIRETVEYRKDAWEKGALGAKTIDGKVQYYIQQQERLLELLSESKVPSLRIDTSDKDWSVYAKKVLQLVM